MKYLYCIILALLGRVTTAGAQTDTAEAATGKKVKKETGFDRFNHKAEALFRILPVPMYSHSTEAGDLFGLAKFNVLHLSKKDTISKPSKLSEVFTISTKGFINASVSTELVFKENQFIVISYINYKKTPEYIFGIGNDVSRQSEETVTEDRFKFAATGLTRVAPNVYAGFSLEISDYFRVQPDSNSFLIRENISGVKGGWDVGLGGSGAFDTRDNRYNASKGAYVIGTLMFYPHTLGSTYEFGRFDLDTRKFIKPWLNHVIAFQATTSITWDDVPFYDLAQLGGDSKMRGYYLGAFRDKTLIDGQMEYRMPVWNIFGVAGWVATGQVAPAYAKLSWNQFRLSYGFGLRIKVDSKSNTNLRFDFGFGPSGVNGFYINFGEAF